MAGSEAGSRTRQYASPYAPASFSRSGGPFGPGVKSIPDQGWISPRLIA